MSRYDELLPCPFCGGTATIGGLVPWAECGLCGSTGKQGGDEAEAAANWNRRAGRRDAVPEGMVLVPREPTKVMQTAGKHALKGAADSPEWQQALIVYAAMLAAAQQQGEG